jgi:DNA-binding response OmpR family regulator
MANILVVDDEIGIRELLSEILSDEGHVVFTAENAAAARSARLREELDLVLLDIWMPDTDGVTLLKEWASHGQLTMPVIMMSGHATIDTAVEATRFGALEFLEKPIAMARLLSAVRGGLERARVMRNLRPLRAAVQPGAHAEPQSGALPVAAREAAPAADAEPPRHNGVALDQPLRDARDQFERVYFEYHLARDPPVPQAQATGNRTRPGPPPCRARRGAGGTAARDRAARRGQRAACLRSAGRLRRLGPPDEPGVNGPSMALRTSPTTHS